MKHYRIQWPENSTLTSNPDAARIIAAQHKDAEVLVRDVTHNPGSSDINYTDWQPLFTQRSDESAQD